MTFCRSIYVKKVMKLLAFIFEQPSYVTKGHHFLIDVRILACRVDSICCIEPIIVRYMYMYIEDI